MASASLKNSPSHHAPEESDLSPVVLKSWMLLRLLGGPLAAIVTVVLMQTGAIPEYQTITVALAAVYGLLVLSVSLLAHWNGVWSIGHPALLAIGAYCAAWGSGHGWGLELSAVVAMVVCAAFGAFLGYAGARFSVLYIALLTMAFTLVITEVISAWKPVTGGDQGVPVNNLDSVFGQVVPAGSSSLCLVVIVFGMVLTIAEAVRRTSLRMRMVASKTHPLAARTIGIAPEAQSALAFAGSAAVAGLAGVMLALVSGYISPESFSLVLAINLISATVLGGTGSLIGAVVGGAFLAGAPSVARSVNIDQPYLIGGLLIVALIFLPAGVVPTLGRLLDRFTRWNERLQQSAMAGHAGAASVLDESEPLREQKDSDDAAVDAVGRQPGEVLLSVRDLGVAYGGLKAVEGIDLNLHAGEVVGIIGPNGAGKTTFVNALSGLTGGGKVTGSATLDGTDLRKVRTVARRRLGLGRTFQHAELFDELTVIENVLAVNRRIRLRDRARAFALLADVDLAEVAYRPPAELPFGLRKRVDLARAIAEKPRLLVLDEPFGGLDAAEREVLGRHIRRLRDAGTCVVIIDHVLEDLFAVTDRVVAFDFGRLVAEGTAETVLEEDVVRRSYLGMIEGETAQAAAPATAAGERVLALTGIDHHFGGVQALRTLDLEVRAGAIVGVVGTNGAGKSTLGRILHGSLRPTAGRREVGKTDGRELRISLVPEGRALFKTLSVRENLEVAAYAAGLSGSAVRTRIAEIAESLPERVRTRMGVAAGSLSGGEQQLVAIARALMADPDVLVLDEPALGLSPAMVQEVYRQIADLGSRGLTTVLLDQSLNRALQSCAEVIVLNQGEIVARGNAAEAGFAEAAEAAYFGDLAGTQHEQTLEVTP
jgi:ABC-type multidrug transport system ATPase subunit/ABC-type branched-subunit amino acid transport system permease subunit